MIASSVSVPESRFGPPESPWQGPVITLMNSPESTPALAMFDVVTRLVPNASGTPLLTSEMPKPTTSTR